MPDRFCIDVETSHEIVNDSQREKLRITKREILLNGIFEKNPGNQKLLSFFAIIVSTSKRLSNSLNRFNENVKLNRRIEFVSLPNELHEFVETSSTKHGRPF